MLIFMMTGVAAIFLFVNALSPHLFTLNGLNSFGDPNVMQARGFQVFSGAIQSEFLTRQLGIFLLVDQFFLPILMVSLLFLLTGIHVHYMMVRAETVVLQMLRPLRVEFSQLVGDILYHKEFVRLKDYHHHSNHIYDHVHRVAFLSYCIAKVLSLNYEAAARGGLLHDFFLYDWRERKLTDSAGGRQQRGLHGREHPYTALENSRRFFIVSDREADIIVKHMFPKTRALPRYPESFVVSISDKIAAVYEYLTKS